MLCKSFVTWLDERTETVNKAWLTMFARFSFSENN